MAQQRIQNPGATSGPRGEETPVDANADDYCVMQVSINGTQVGWLAASGDNYLEIAEERVGATAFQFPVGGGHVLPPYGDIGQRGLGISDKSYPQFYLPSGWWANWKLVRGYLLCESNLQFVAIENPADPYGAWLKVDNALTPLQMVRQTL